MAVEREIERDPAAPSPNCLFDQSGNFIIYPTHLGIKAGDERCCVANLCCLACLIRA